jgi:hypothetical protein
MKPHNYNELILNKGAKKIRWRKDSLFNKKKLLGKLVSSLQKSETRSMFITLYQY